MRYMKELVFDFSFQNCQLQQSWPVQDNTICVGPRCQCVKQQRPDRKATLRIHRRRVRVPEWVTVSCLHLVSNAVKNFEVHCC